MDCTELALKLITSYRNEHNRLKRAQNALRRYRHDEAMVAKRLQYGFAMRDELDNWKGAGYLKKHFIDISGRASYKAFVSAGCKRACIKREQYFVEMYLNCNPPQTHQAEEHKKTLESFKKAPVEAELGMWWKEWIALNVERLAADKARWEARCAIKAFNKMDTGIRIKFGNCSVGGGSMSAIHKVILEDGTEMTPAKFLDIATFETAILKG